MLKEIIFRISGLIFISQRTGRAIYSQNTEYRQEDHYQPDSAVAFEVGINPGHFDLRITNYDLRILNIEF